MICSARPIQCEGTKPRALLNIIQKRGGRGSCFINVALQALMTPAVVKEELQNIWRQMVYARRQKLWDVATTLRRFAIDGETWGSSVRHGDRLAVTFYYSPAEKRTEPQSPCIVIFSLMFVIMNTG